MTLSVSELADAINSIFDVAAPHGVWVAGQISSISRPRSGHVYFDLIEPSDAPGAPPRAKMAVALFRWAKTGVNAALTSHGGAVRMTEGVGVRLHGRLDYYAPTGQLKLVMDAIDPAYTLARLVTDREIVLRRLATDGVLNRNRGRPLPPVPLRLGLVTARGSAAHSDMVRTLENSGFGFSLVEADVPVQGTAAPTAIASAIAAVAAVADVVLVARGGGSKTDLVAFDHESVARAVALCPRPVVTGIGHEIDRSAADAAAHTACATPTAAAETVVKMVAAWLDRLDAVARSISDRSLRLLGTADLRLTRAANHLGDRGRGAIERGQRHLDTVATRIMAFDPALALRRGWSITRRLDGSLVRSASDVAPGTRLITQLSDGELASVVEA